MHARAARDRASPQYFSTVEWATKHHPHSTLLFSLQACLFFCVLSLLPSCNCIRDGIWSSGKTSLRGRRLLA